jgi:chitin disaccharide deacetylase
MTKERLFGLIRNLPDGLSEIYLHPATGAFVGAEPGYRYREEFDALMDSEIIAASRDTSLRLGGFSDFLASQTASRGGQTFAAVSNGSLIP